MFTRALSALALGALFGGIPTTLNPPSPDELSNETVLLECSLMIDFPGSTGEHYIKLDRRKIRDTIDYIAGHGLDKAQGKRFFYTAEVKAVRGIPCPVDVRGQLDLMIGEFNKITQSAVKFDEVNLPSLVDYFAGTAYAEIDHFVRLPNEIPAAEEGNPVSDADEPPISCVRFIWRDGKLIAIYNYVVDALNPDHEPDVLKRSSDTTPFFATTKPTYCAVAEFVVQF